MQVHDKVVVVTGAADGIGPAIALRYGAEGVAGVMAVDIDELDMIGTARFIDSQEA